MAYKKVLLFMFASFGACSASGGDNASMSNLGQGPAAPGDGRLDNGRCDGYAFGCSQASIDALQNHCDDVCNAAGGSSRGVKYCYALTESGGTPTAAGTGELSDVCSACDCGSPQPSGGGNCGDVTSAGSCTTPTVATYCVNGVLTVKECDNGQSCERLTNGNVDCDFPSY
jgi:hypothetical protein